MRVDNKTTVVHYEEKFFGHLLQTKIMSFILFMGTLVKKLLNCYLCSLYNDDNKSIIVSLSMII